VAFRLAARSADLVYITPRDTDSAGSIVSEIRAHEAAEGRSDPPLRIFADAVVFLDEDAPTAQNRKQRFDDLDGKPLRSDALIFVGTPADLAELMVAWQAAGIDGFRLRPGAMPHDLEMITHEVVGALQDRSAFRHHYEDATLRARLGLPRPASRYALA
jgi:alkanesulfonate monooxygenase SsuD/methylene tetrahydromethanopterin reductase-like flavin-dependent oxidoreductase (luciferase family)